MHGTVIGRIAIRFVPRSRWREKECYGIFYCFKVLEDMLKQAKFHLKTNHKNLVYINCALTGMLLDGTGISQYPGTGKVKLQTFVTFHKNHNLGKFNP
jgi:hypothetical protein